MANPELVRTIDYILNRCDEQGIDAVAAAVVRRRRELAMFGGMANLPDPKKMASQISGQINIGASIEGLRETVRDVAVRIIRREAPELSDEQIAELCAAWIPGSGPRENPGKTIPPDLLQSMTDQFIRFSTGKMPRVEEKSLRKELGAWPERYWKAFPEIVQLIIRDYLDGEINEKEYHSKLATALALEE